MMNKERNRNMMKQIPYGLTDFGRIQKENYYYVDKTMFIEKIEMQCKNTANNQTFDSCRKQFCY